MSGLLFANVSSIAATVLILLLRKFFKEKLFAKTFVFLWLLVIIRLLVPFEFYSSISAFAPEKEPVFAETNEPFYSGNFEEYSGSKVENQVPGTEQNPKKAGSMQKILSTDPALRSVISDLLSYLVTLLY